MLPSDSHVVIIGAGPAGSATAIKCAEAGLKVTLVEREQKPFSDFRPGETLHPGAGILLKQLGVEKQVSTAGFLRHQGHWVEWNHEPRFSKFGKDEEGPWQGFQAWRTTFDEILLDRAGELGARILRPSRAIRPILSKDRVVGVETSDCMLESEFLIDAAGGYHWLAKKIGLAIEEHSAPLIAWYGYAKGSCPARDGAPAIVAEEDGWIWTAKVRPNLYQWTKLSFERNQLERDYVPSEFRSLVPIAQVRGANVTWRMVPRCAGNGYFIVGDASFVLDPLSSHGVLKALMSGMMVAHIIAKIVQREKGEASLAHAYRQWMSDWYLHDQLKLREYYMNHPRRPGWMMTDRTLLPVRPFASPIS